MSYHDRRLLGHRKAVAAKRSDFSRGIRKGAMSLTLFPAPLKMKFGTIGDDWRAVGNDLRKAMKSLEACE